MIIVKNLISLKISINDKVIGELDKSLVLNYPYNIFVYGKHIKVNLLN